jgi:hypothetical protein
MCAKRESFEQRGRLNKKKEESISIQIAKGKRFGRRRKRVHTLERINRLE